MLTLALDFRLAWRNLRRNIRRTAVAVMTVAFGIVAFMLAGGFIDWVLQAMREGTIHSQLGHLQVVRPGYFEKGIADPYAYLLADKLPERQLINRHPSSGRRVARKSSP